MATRSLVPKQGLPWVPGASTILAEPLSLSRAPPVLLLTDWTGNSTSWTTIGGVSLVTLFGEPGRPCCSRCAQRLSLCGGAVGTVRLAALLRHPYISWFSWFCNLTAFFPADFDFSVLVKCTNSFPSLCFLLLVCCMHFISVFYQLSHHLFVYSFPVFVFLFSLQDALRLWRRRSIVSWQCVGRWSVGITDTRNSLPSVC